MKLGEGLNPTFQQIQKYEKGTNRISASRLQQIGAMFAVPISFFFEGAPVVELSSGGLANPIDHSLAAKLIQSDECVRLAKAFVAVKSKAARRRIIELVETLALRDGFGGDTT